MNPYIALRPSLATIAMVPIIALFTSITSCGNGNAVSSEESARRAYFGLDTAIGRAINLGLAGFNAASSANIPPQTGNGDTSGTLTVSGHVDQGSSANKTMNLNTAFATYADPVRTSDDAGTLHVVYDTSGTLPALSIMLQNIPNGTFSGTFAGTVTMSGDLQGDVTLNLTLSGQIEPVSGSATMVQQTPGTTHITGTAESSYGTYTVDVTR